MNLYSIESAVSGNVISQTPSPLLSLIGLQPPHQPLKSPFKNTPPYVEVYDVISTEKLTFTARLVLNELPSIFVPGEKSSEVLSLCCSKLPVISGLRVYDSLGLSDNASESNDKTTVPAASLTTIISPELFRLSPEVPVSANTSAPPKDPFGVPPPNTTSAP